MPAIQGIARDLTISKLATFIALPRSHLSKSASNVGQLGDGRIGASSLIPVVVDIDSVEYIGVGDRVACALREDQSAWCWGANDFG